MPSKELEEQIELFLIRAIPPKMVGFQPEGFEAALVDANKNRRDMFRMALMGLLYDFAEEKIKERM